MSPPVSAIVVVFDPAGRALLLRRSGTCPRWPGQWNFPGGYLKPGESVPTAAARELAEESGISLSPAALSWCFSYRSDEGLSHVLSAALPRRPRVRFGDGEHDAAVWADLSSLPSPLLPGADFVARQIQEKGASPMPRKFPPGAMPMRYPGYLPYPAGYQPLSNAGMEVPNEAKCFWPQAQFAPSFLPPGSPSYQPYVFPDYSHVPKRAWWEKGSEEEEKLAQESTGIAFSGVYGDCGCGCQGKPGGCGQARANPSPAGNLAIILAGVAGFWAATSYLKSKR